MIINQSIARMISTITFVDNDGNTHSGVMMGRTPQTFNIYNRKVSDKSIRFNYSDVKSITSQTLRDPVYLPHFDRLMKGLI